MDQARSAVLVSKNSPSVQAAIDRRLIRYAALKVAEMAGDPEIPLLKTRDLVGGMLFVLNEIMLKDAATWPRGEAA